MTQIIKRDLLGRLIAHLQQKEATVLIGPRQSGKTTLLLVLKDYLVKEGVDKENIFYFNLDRYTDLEFFSSQEEVIKFIESRKKLGKLYFFVDEAQRIKEAGRFFKGIYDLNFNLKLVLTGSSSLDIKSQFVESLTGRKRVFFLYPFNFHEFLLAKNSNLAQIFRETDSLSIYDKKKIEALLDEFLIFGGYPRVVLEESAEQKKLILEEIYNSYLEKDIIAFLRVKKPMVFKKLTSMLAFQVGQLVNFNELSQSLAVERKTLESYLNILEETFIVKLILPFFANPRKELVKMPKLFFIDNGFRNLAINNLEGLSGRQDEGQLLENFIASEILKDIRIDYQLHFWRTHYGTETDFILKKGRALLPVEVKARLKKLKAPAGLQSFIERYAPEKAHVINRGIEGEYNHLKTKILFSYPYNFFRNI